MDKIETAIKLSTKAHSGQKRKFSNVDYIEHPFFVADILASLKISKHIDDLIVACILHDVVEDTYVTIEEIREIFGDFIASLVEELTSDIKEIKRIGKKEYLANKMLNMTSYGLVIKLSDRLHNILDLKKEYPLTKKYIIETEYILDKLNERHLSNTHKKLIKLIENKIIELK